MYYQMWSDGIYSLQKKKEKNPTMLPWQVGSLTAVSFSQCLNVITLFFWLTSAGLKMSIFIYVNVSSIGFINKFLSFLILLLPFYIINYFMIFHKNKYKRIIEKYPPKNDKGRLMILYFVLSFAVFLVPLYVMLIIR